jgi:hypothetical protein
MSAGHTLDFDVRQEDDTVATHRLLRVSGASVVIGAVGVFFAAVLLVGSTGSLRPSFAGPPGRARIVPRAISRIEQTPIWVAQPGIDLRDSQRRELESWGWVDRGAGIAHIPIQRAMDIVAKEAPR